MIYFSAIHFSKGIYPEVELKVEITDFLAASDPTKPNCDNQYRSSIASTVIPLFSDNFSDSLEFIRMERVCSIHLSGDRNVTNKYGLALFENFKISRGPQGTYSFTFVDT